MATFPFPTINSLEFVAYSGARIITFDGATIFVTGQPSRDAIARFGASGIRTVINVRQPGETTSTPPPYPAPPVFDAEERKLVESQGIVYYNDPKLEIWRTMTQPEFDRNASYGAIALWSGISRGGATLIHCSTGDRASSVFAVLLITAKRLSNSDAVSYCENTLLLAAPPIVTLVQGYQTASALTDELNEAMAKAQKASAAAV
ncbi:MAG TPA: hypothetical protein VFB22_08380 [Candidatus Baltobacteraceae bacterium]|nr:hypothetical protein [Candidatus Baltobacteraceae bacterium]